MKSNLLKVAALSVLLIGLGSCGNDPKPTTSSEGTASTPVAQTSSTGDSTSSTGETISSTTEEEQPKTLADLYDKSVEFSELEDGNITETKVINDDFSAPLVAGDTNHNLTVETLGTAVVIDELTFTKRIKTGGDSHYTQPYRVFEFEATAQCDIDIYIKAGGEARGAAVYNVDKSQEESTVVAPLEAGKITLKAYYADTYRIGFIGGCDVYGIGVKFGEGEGEFIPQQPELKDANILNISELNNETIKENLTRGNFTINAGSDKATVIDPTTGEEKTENHSVSIDSNSKHPMYNGVKQSYKKRLRLGGTGTPEYRSVSITVTGPSIIDIVAMSSSSDAGQERSCVVVDSTKTTVGTFTATTGAEDPDDSSKKNQPEVYSINISSAGTYTLYSTKGGLNIYAIYIGVAA